MGRRLYKEYIGRLFSYVPLSRTHSVLNYKAYLILLRSIKKIPIPLRPNLHVN